MRIGPSLAVTVVVVVAASRGRLAPALAVAVALAAVEWLVSGRRARLAAVTLFAALVLAGAVAAWRASSEIAALDAGRLGPHRGWAEVVLEPDVFNGATRVVIEIDGQRHEMWVRGRARQLRVATWTAGDHVWVDGVRRALASERAGRVAWQHVVGRFDADVLGNRRDGTRLATATNRMRAVLSRGTAPLGPPYGALADGLIFGDDRRQAPEMIARFRASGLSHLVAVSGQNVAFVIAAVGPVLTRLRPMPRLAATVLVIGWFVLLTRAEPSILRAGTMASFSAVAFAVGRERSPTRLLALATTTLVLVDPMLVRSIGFWMSIGATAGVTVLTTPIQDRLRRCGPLSLPLATTIAAQAGVTVPVAAVFGVPQAIGILANLAAVPVAGFVMLYGMPAALVGGFVGRWVPVVAEVLMVPVAVAVRWVDGVAAVAARFQLGHRANVAAWIAVGAAIVGLGGRRDAGRQRRSREDGRSHGRALLHRR